MCVVIFIAISFNKTQVPLFVMRGTNEVYFTNYIYSPDMNREDKVLHESDMTVEDIDTLTRNLHGKMSKYTCTLATNMNFFNTKCLI